ncbi:hypothetical protein OOZ15_03360 [Galbibacter sp. EGI 63066]|uniref:hypothetical protein n=1 Tax=Galbibacter sp. EGI 63066 TaxID=2993559 RepID=UPI00224878B7|nr:hypothetical protein [Galbibacter sp. EGI 63066]MCX2678968.1 hypothetical protein [Galbibacter sp. EGI 63066]
MQSNVWSIPAMCMTPTANTVQENKYVTTAGRVKFKAGESGKIVFVASVSKSFPEGRYALRAHLERKVADLLGTNIQLRRANRVNGAVETILTCVGVQIDPVQNNIRFSDSNVENLKIDLDKFYYWIQVTDSNASPATKDSVDAVLGVSIVRIS